MPAKTTPPLTPRAFLAACRDLVGDRWLIKLFRVSPRSLQRWVALRPYVDEDSVRENYLEKHETLMEKLWRTPGGPEVARAIVARHAHLVGCELAACGEVVPDKDTLESELLDDYPPTVAFHDAIRAGEDIDTVRHRWQTAKGELDETFFKYQAEANPDRQPHGG